MCGIIGYRSLSNNVYLEEMNVALKTLEHRGPNSSDIWYSIESGIGLAHARLSLIGINNGNQPLKNEDNTIVCVVNGEFYDYKKIRKELISDGYKFYTETDSEVLISLYQKYGFGCLSHLNGEFSFILWDAKNNLLFSARDRFGTKPLYYCFHNGDLFLASEIKALLNFNIPAKWNINSLLSTYAGVPLCHTSCFKDIFMVQPGHYLISSGKNFNEVRYWTPHSHPTQPNSIIDINKASIEFYKLLKLSVKRRLHADMPVGVYLSGGIDSSAILRIASEYDNTIRAFTISFNEEEYDEYENAKLVSDYLKTNLSVLSLNFTQLADNYSKVIYHRESPVYQTSGIGKFLLSQFVNNSGYKAVLTGEGADEILLGYPSFKEDLLTEIPNENFRLNQLEQLRFSTKRVEDAYVSRGNYDSLTNELGYVPSFLKLSYDICTVMSNLVSRDFKNILSIHTPINNFILSEKNECKNYDENVYKSVYLWSKTYFPELILSYLGDRSEMAHSIEARLPFLDLHLVEFVSSLPIELKINKKIEKFILRKAMKDLLPSHIVTRPKHIYAAPGFLNNCNNPLYVLFMDILNSRQFKELPFFNLTYINNYLKNIELFSNRQIIITEFALNLIMSTYFLLREFKFLG